MSDKGQGIYRKFDVIRTDGSSGSGGKHEHCSYFVLDMTHDSYAPAALMAYSEECRETHPALSEDLRAWTSEKFREQRATENKVKLEKIYGHLSEVSASPPIMPDMVNHPPHYKTESGLEAIQVIEAFALNFNLGQVAKYVLRAGKKGDRTEDLKKAAWYLAREIGGQSLREQMKTDREERGKP